MSMLNTQRAATATEEPNKCRWTSVVLTNSADYFGTRALVNISGTVDGRPFRKLFMAVGDGTRKLPIKADVRKAIAKQAGDSVTVRLDSGSTTEALRG